MKKNKSENDSNYDNIFLENSTYVVRMICTNFEKKTNGMSKVKYFVPEAKRIWTSLVDANSFSLGQLF